MIDETAASTAFKALDILERELARLKEENARLRQERDAANAQLDFIMENMNESK